MKQHLHIFRSRSARLYSHWIGTAVLAATVAMASPADAATQGTLGVTSTGSITITASVPAVVQISGLSDMAFTSVSPGASATITQNTCVWSNTSTRGYSIQAIGSGTGGIFTLLNGATTVPYSVAWAKTSGASTGTALSPNTTTAGMTSTAITPTCASGIMTATLLVTIAASDLQTMVGGNSYTGTLSLTVAPI